MLAIVIVDNQGSHPPISPTFALSLRKGGTQFPQKFPMVRKVSLSVLSMTGKQDSKNSTFKHKVIRRLVLLTELCALPPKFIC